MLLQRCRAGTHLRARAAAQGGRRARPRTTCRTCSTYLGNTAEYTYSETPPPASRTLDGFLFDSKQGYCQQFSGAMALLLRMAGIPARVSTGFSTGATDTKTGEYVVRDFDAHSWVEVYYPDYGWITFDPTPAASPARSQPADAVGTSGSTPASTVITSGDLLSERGAGVPVAAESRPWWHYALLALALLGRRRARVPRRPPLAPRRTARAERVRARAQAHPRRAHARHDPARARAALRRHARRRGLRARAAREPLPRRTRPPDPRPAPRAALRARTRRRPARPPARLVGPATSINGPGRFM